MRQHHTAKQSCSELSSYKYKGWIFLPITMLAILTVAFIYGIIVYEKVLPPQQNDTQCIILKEVERFEDGSWTAFSLPDYLEIDKEEHLRIKLDYSFSKNTTPALILQANHTFMSFELEDKILYEVEEQERSLGNYFTYFPLPSQLQDEYLEIRITVADKTSHRVLFPEIYISDEASFLKTQLAKDLPSLCCLSGYFGVESLC